MTDQVVGAAEAVTEAKPEKYHTVNSQWPKGPLPELENDEAITAARKLIRLLNVLDHPDTFRTTTGNRQTWVRGGVFYVNPSKGWRDLVHSVSHYAHHRLHPNDKNHSHKHAWIEREMVQHVVKKGWLDGALRKPKARTAKAQAAVPVPIAAIDAPLPVQTVPVVVSVPVVVKPGKREMQRAKLDNILERVKRWEQKERRAQTALAKLNKQRRYYERQLSI
jgi:hypothetical protein